MDEFGFMLEADIMRRRYSIEQARMNRRKKGNKILKARAKKANAKLAPHNKPKYISKADRAKLAEECGLAAGPSSEG